MMEMLTDIFSAVLILGGSFFALTGAVGILRMPDFYSRIHPAGKSDTLAQTMIMTGLFLQALQEEQFGIQAGIKLIIIILFLFITSPTAVHAIAKAAHVDGLRYWQDKEQSDD
ncbi:MAG: monovalent cation/H(+) antiporter subunit G [Thermodesulfobacteriota bacterium]